MRNAFKLLALVAGIAATAVSCNKEAEVPQVEEPLKLVIRAGAPQTKTSITFDGNKTYTPSWSANDAIGVYFTTVEGESTEFINADAGDVALFAPTSEITSVSGAQTLYSFYPRSAFNAVKDTKSIRVNVKDVQSPDALGTFDKTADLLVAKPYAGNITKINEDGGIIDLAFARILSVVKITPSESATAIDNEYVKSIKIEYNGSGADAPLTGRVVLDLDSGEFGDWTIKTYSASANYGESVFALNGTNAAYLLVNPATISSGKKVTFTVKTNKHDAAKEFTLGKDLVFPAGNIAKIDLSIDDSWTIEDNTLDPNIIFKAPFSAYSSGTTFISSTTTYDSNVHGDLGVVGTSKSTITYSFAGSGQLRNTNNRISSDDASYYWSTSSTDLTIGGINVGANQYFNLSFARYCTQQTASLTISISEDGINFFPITSTSPISIANSAGRGTLSYNFSIPAGNRSNIRIKLSNSTTNGLVIDNVTLTRLDDAGDNNKAVSLEVVAEDPTLVVSPSPVNLIEGNTQQLSVTGTNGTIHYLSNDTDVATVSSTGLVSAVAEGTTTISITSDATANYNAGSTTVIVIVSATPTPESLPYSNSLLGSHDGFTINTVSAGGLTNVWTDNLTYGFTANGNNCTSSIESYAESPMIDLTSVNGAKLSFSHAINYFADVATAKTQATLQVRVEGGAWDNVTIPNYSASLGNSFTDTEVDLSAYAGEIIQFRFKYLATTTKPGRWQIKNLSVTEVVTHTVTINQPASGGTIAATVDDVAITSGDSILEGKTIVLTATPASGYKFSSWTVTGALVSGNTASATVVVGNSDIEISSTFTELANSAVTIASLSSEQIADNCSFTVSVEGVASPIASNTNVQEGKTITLAATSGSTYTFSSWNVYKTGETNTKITVNSTTNTFVMPAYAITVEAVFTAGPANEEFFSTYSNTGTSNSSNNDITGDACNWTGKGATIAYWSNISDGSAYSTAVTLLKPASANGTYIISEELSGGITSITVCARSNNGGTGVNVYIINVDNSNSETLVGTVNTTSKKTDFSETFTVTGVTGNFKIKITNKNTTAYCCVPYVAWE